MATGISTYLVDAIIDRIFRGTAFTTHPVYVSLHTGDPGSAGSNEVTGGSYARISISTNWDAAASKATQNSVAIDFTDMPSCTVTHVGLWDDVSSGNFLWGGALSGSVTITAGDGFQFAIGDLDVTIV